MKILSNSKITNYCLIASIGFLVIIMLSSFIIRISNPPITADLHSNIETNNEIEQRIRVNVLNACGKKGLANEVKLYLMERKFDVVSIDNYVVNNQPVFLEKSYVVDRVGDFETSYQVAYAMGINNSYVTSDIDSNLCVRTTIIVGRDFFELKPFALRTF